MTLLSSWARSFKKKTREIKSSLPPQKKQTRTSWDFDFSCTFAPCYYIRSAPTAGGVCWLIPKSLCSADRLDLYVQEEPVGREAEIGALFRIEKRRGQQAKEESQQAEDPIQRGSSRSIRCHPTRLALYHPTGKSHRPFQSTELP